LFWSWSQAARLVVDVVLSTITPRLHDTTGCQTGWTTGWTTGWMFVYTIQPVVQPVVKRVWQPVGQQAVSCIQTFNRLNNRLFNRWAVWQPRLNNRLHPVKTNIQPVVKQVEQPVWQPVVSCKRGVIVDKTTSTTRRAACDHDQNNNQEPIIAKSHKCVLLCLPSYHCCCPAG